MNYIYNLMPCWPLLLPPPAVPTVPSRPSSLSRHCTVPRCQVAVAVTPSLAVVPRHPSPSICHRAVHRRPSPLCSLSIAGALMPSLTNEEPSIRPLLSRSHRAVHCRRCRGAIAPSLPVEEPSRRPSPSRSRCAVHCRRGAVAPYLAIKEPSAVSKFLLTTPSTRHAPTRPLVQMVVALPLLTPPLSICRRLSLRHRLLCLCPSGWLSRLLASHAATSHLPAPPPLIAQSPLDTPLSGLSSSWFLMHRLSSRRHHISAV